MASDLISREALVEYLRRDFGYHFPLYDGSRLGTTQLLVTREDVISAILHNIPAVDAIPIDDVAEMLAELFGEECCCDYNGIDEWLPFLCEYSDTCPETIGKNGCWKQFIKHWKERKKNDGD